MTNNMIHISASTVLASLTLIPGRPGNDLIESIIEVIGTCGKDWDASTIASVRRALERHDDDVRGLINSALNSLPC